MKINIILPSFPLRASGGHKIMYEYANRLSRLGHEIVIYHSLYVPFVKYNMPLFLRKIRINTFHNNSKPNWFLFETKVRLKTISKIRNFSIEDGDILMSTWFSTNFETMKLPDRKGKKVNLIQGFENWNGHIDKVFESYKLPIEHIVISDYLADMVEKQNGKRPRIIYNAIDSTKFHITEKIENRNPYSISMLYSKLPIKGSDYGIEAFRICKEKYPDLKVTLFSISQRPSNLPNWIKFFQSPPNLIEIYNNSAIFFSPSIGEGWALPPAEAMNCGCALVCTDIGGHATYAINNKTALLVKPQDSVDMAQKLCSLLENTDLRIKFAKQGYEYIKEFTWENSINKMESILASLAGR